MRRFVPVVALLAAGGCRSSAPYTVPAAVAHSALAVGAAAVRRAQGDCFTPCSHGTECNPRTGYCEPSPCGKCQAWESCVENETGIAQCVVTAAPGAGMGSIGGFAPGIGVSPATGSVPTLPPEKASPEKP